MTTIRHGISKIFIAGILFLFLGPSLTYAQSEFEIQSSATLAEKIYLQLDRNVYSKGNIVWFKAVLTNAFDHVPSQLSGVLHVELIGSDETIYKEKLVKIENGIGQGSFQLNEDLPDGVFLIRAYTQWDKNFGTDFFFEEYIRVLALSKDEETAAPISNVTLVKNETSDTRLEASFHPFAIDSLHKNNLKVFIEVDGKKDTLLVEKGVDEQYRIEYEIPDESQFTTLQMQTSGKQKYTKTIVLDKDYLDLQFFPESGELVHGLNSRVGFKAIDANGQGTMVEGAIVDENDAIITSFKSNALGMGSFYLENADTSKTYYGRLKSRSEENEILLYPLPNVASRGNILSVVKQGNNMRVTAISNYLENDSISLHVSLRGVRFFDLRVPLKNGIRSVIVPGDKIPEGIVSFKMLDKSFQPVAERLYFNERPNSRININISSDKARYEKREQTNLEIETTKFNDKPVKAGLSLLVLNKNQLGTMQQMRQNILSYFLLDSELKGEIENSGFYFKEGNNNFHKDMDALMLTQGWRKYNYTKPSLETLTYEPETNLSVTGFVGGVFAENKGKEVDLTMMTFSNNKAVYSQTSDSAGRFKFILNDEFGEEIDLLIQTKSTSGKKRNYSISLDERETPPVNFEQVKTIEKPDSVVQFFAKKNLERKKVDDAFTLQSGNILIDEVEITGYRNNPARKKVLKTYGEPDEVIAGSAIEEKEEKWSYGLYSVLNKKFYDQVRIIQSEDSVYASANNSEKTLVIIDGIPVRPYEYDLLPYIPVSEVLSFEIIEYADNFLSLYIDLFPDSLHEAPAFGNVIAIYTHAQTGLYGAIKPVGIMRASVPAYSKPVEFYAPKYDKPQSEESDKPDLRALVHWEPLLNTDNLGKTSASFYNADNPGEMLVVVEAISEKGEIGYQELTYSVAGEEKDLIILDIH